MVWQMQGWITCHTLMSGGWNPPHGCFIKTGLCHAIFLTIVMRRPLNYTDASCSWLFRSQTRVKMNLCHCLPKAVVFLSALKALHFASLLHSLLMTSTVAVSADSWHSEQKESSLKSNEATWVHLAKPMQTNGRYQLPSRVLLDPILQTINCEKWQS